MRGFERDDEDLIAELEEVEVALLGSLVSQVNELLGGAHAAPASSDPFEAWAKEFDAGVELDLSDPLIRRLFPDAYADDAVAAAEHRRLSQDDLRRDRVTDGMLVLSDLAATRDGRLPLVVPPGHVDAWLKTVNGLRLSLAVRLGIETDADMADLRDVSIRDPRSQLLAIHDWLGVLLESLLDALDA